MTLRATIFVPPTLRPVLRIGAGVIVVLLLLLACGPPPGAYVEQLERQGTQVLMTVTPTDRAPGATAGTVAP